MGKQQEEEKKEEPKRITLNSFQIVVGIIFTISSIYFGFNRFIKEQPHIDLHVNSIDFGLDIEAYESDLAVRLDDIEEIYFDITGLELYSLIDSIYIGETIVTKSFVKTEIQEMISYYDSASIAVEGNLIFDGYEIYTENGNDVSLYIDEYQDLIISRLDSAAFDSLYYSYIEDIKPELLNTFINFMEVHILDMYSGLIQDLTEVEEKIEELWPKPSYSEIFISLTIENKSRNSNVIRPMAILYLSENIDDSKDTLSSLSEVELEFRDRNINLEPSSIQTKILTSELIDLTGKSTLIQNDEYIELAQGIIEPTDANNFILGIQDIHNKFWWFEGNILQTNTIQNREEFYEEVKKSDRNDMIYRAF